MKTQPHEFDAVPKIDEIASTRKMTATSLQPGPNMMSTNGSAITNRIAHKPQPRKAVTVASRK